MQKKCQYSKIILLFITKDHTIECALFYDNLEE